MSPTLCIIAAMARNGVIGRDNAIPWQLPADLKRFRTLTLGHPVIMGRRTFESIVAYTGKALDRRENIVITRSRDWYAEGCRIVHSLEQAIEAAGRLEVFVIGGAEIYALALPIASHLYLTEIGSAFAGDAFFPDVDWSRWQEISREPHVGDGPEGLEFAFVKYARIA